MKTKEEIRGMSVQDITKELRSLSRELFEIKIKIHTGQEKDISKHIKIKRQIARYKTILIEKKIGEKSPVKK